MKAVQMLGAGVVGAIIGAAAMALLSQSPGGPPPPPPEYSGYDRDNAVTLVRDQAGACQAHKSDPFRGFQHDTMRWRIHDTCNLGRTGVHLVFTQSNPDDGNGKFDDTFNANGDAELHLKIKDLTGVASNVGRGWRFPYVLRIEIDGKPKDLNDPVLEVDPW